MEIAVVIEPAKLETQDQLLRVTGGQYPGIRVSGEQHLPADWRVRATIPRDLPPEQCGPVNEASARIAVAESAVRRLVANVPLFRLPCPRCHGPMDRTRSIVDGEPLCREICSGVYQEDGTLHPDIRKGGTPACVCGREMPADDLRADAEDIWQVSLGRPAYLRLARDMGTKAMAEQLWAFLTPDERQSLADEIEQPAAGHGT